MRWLVVFDGADTPSLLYNFWPYNGQGSVIITSGDSMAMGNFYYGDLSGTILDCLTEEEAVDLIRKLLRQTDQDKEDHQCMLQVVKQIYHYPLAIVQLTGAMRWLRLPLNIFLNEYENEINRAQFFAMQKGTQHSYTNTLAGIWSLPRLPLPTASVMSTISLLAPNLIQEEILTTAPEKTGLNNSPKSGFAFAQTITEVTTSSILNYQTSSHGKLA